MTLLAEYPRPGCADPRRGSEHGYACHRSRTRSMKASKNLMRNPSDFSTPRYTVFPQRVDVDSRLGHFDRMPGDPELPQLRGRLGMELDAPGVGAVDPESLVRELGASRQDPRSRRRLEDVVVPLIDTGGFLQVAEERILGRGVGRDDLEPPPLRLGRPRHLAPQSACEDLGAEADSEHRKRLFHGPLEEQALAP